MGIEENFQAVKALVPRLQHFFMVQDLMYLKRGGRVGAATAIVGSALGIKPMLKIDENGKLVTVRTLSRPCSGCRRRMTR